MGRSILTLTHLYPSPALPALGPFVRDQVVELAKRNRVAVVAPLLSSLTNRELARRVRAAPRRSTEGGVDVLRPRPPTLHFAGMYVRSRAWSLVLERVVDRAYRELGGDLLHAHAALPDGFVGARYAAHAGAPLVVTAWGSDVMVSGGKRSLRGLLRRTFGEARAVVAVSDELAARAESLGAAAERLRVIPGGVPYRAPVPREQARERLGLGPSLCVLWVGGLVPVKQPLHAIEAFEHLARASDREVVLALVGDGPLLGDVEAQVRRRGLASNVRMLGHRERDEVWAWHCAADVLVNSSRSEGTPLAVLEALGAGTPVAAYPVGGIGAALEAVGGGVLADARTPNSLAAAAAGALAGGHDRAALAARARRRFSIEESVRALEDVYDAVLAGRDVA